MAPTTLRMAPRTIAPVQTIIQVRGNYSAFERWRAEHLAQQQAAEAEYRGARETHLSRLRLQALGDGIMDAGILVVYEGRMRPKEVQHGPWVEYQRDKLRASLMLALRKRPVSSDSVDESIARIEEKLLSLGEKEIPSERVGELVMRELKRLDKVAYIRFASVYRSFADIESFESALKELK